MAWPQGGADPSQVALGRITIRERIDPAIIASLFSNYRSSADAVRELIDNAVDSRFSASHLAVEVTVRPTSLVVMSSGGAPLTMNKSDFDRDSPLWVEVEERLGRVLAPIVRRLEREGEAPPPASAVKVAEQVRRLLGQVLRLTEREDIFAGLAPPRRGPPPVGLRTTFHWTGKSSRRPSLLSRASRRLPGSRGGRFVEGSARS